MQSPKSVSSGNPQNLIALLLLDVQYLRDVARMFQARSTYRVAQGNIDGAIEDKLTSMRFGRLVPQGGCMVQHLVGIAIEVGGIAIPVGANPEHPLTEQQIRRLLDGIDALPPRVPLNDVFEWERYSGLSTAQETVKGRISLFDIGSLTKASPLERAALSSCDWNVIYRRVNEVYDAMQEPSPKTKFHSLIPAPGRMFTAGKVTGLSNSNARGHFAADLLITLCIPEVDAMEEAVLRSECAENLQRLSLAVLLYQCENGKLPDENWAAQIEKYLGENPKQHFSCPSNPSPEGQTTYAMMQYGDKVDSRNVLMFVELTAPVPLDKAVVSVDDVLNRRNTGSLHPGGMVTSYYSTTVRFISNTVNDEELRRLLGQ
ncbi:MAG: hypothetical protein FWE67_12440 [Planctomycetaceae bacterium]|nr:hypothetical protein [Planctomycetaceae bacterium]